MIPQYIMQMIAAKRIVPAPAVEQGENMRDYGYIYRLYRLNNNQRIKTLENEAIKVVSWARRRSAESYIHRRVYYSIKEHRKPHYKKDYILLVITDPVAVYIDREIEKLRSNRQSV